MHRKSLHMVSLQGDLRVTIITKISSFISVSVILYINDDILYTTGIQAQENGLEKAELVV